jgi:hypothetical protein
MATRYLPAHGRQHFRELLLLLMLLPHDKFGSTFYIVRIILKVRSLTTRTNPAAFSLCPVAVRH